MTTQPLFLDSVHKLSFEKIAMPVKLTDSPDAWQREIASEVYKQLPFLGDYSVNVVLDRVDAQRGYAFGSAQVSNRSQATGPQQEDLPKLRIPIIVSERMMQPLDVFMDGKGVFPLTPSRVRERLFRTDTFESTNRKPVDRQLIDQLYPPDRNAGGGGMGAMDGAEKVAGLRDYWHGVSSGTRFGISDAKNILTGKARKGDASYLAGRLTAGAGVAGTGYAVGKHKGKKGKTKKAGVPKGMLGLKNVGEGASEAAMNASRRLSAHAHGQAAAKGFASAPSAGFHRYSTQRLGAEADVRLGQTYRDASKGIFKKANPAEQGRLQMIRSMKADAAANPTEYGAKLAGEPENPKPSLVESIAPTISENDSDDFVNEIVKDPALMVAASRNDGFQKLAMFVASTKHTNLQKTAQALVDNIKPNVVQFTKLASGDFRVKWANAQAFAPQEGVVGPDEASSMAGADMGEVPADVPVTVSSEKAVKASLDEPVFVAVNEFGHYQCQNAESNEMMQGWTVPMIDFDMQPLEMFVFAGEHGWAVQDEIAGQARPEAPELFSAMLGHQAHGSGVFVHVSEGGNVRALLPMTIQNQSQGPDGGTQIHAETLFGEPVTLSLSPGLQAIQQIGEQDYAMPDTFQWLPLEGKPLHLAKQPLDVQAVQQAKQAPGQVDIGSTGQGEFSMEGQPVEKVAKEHRHFIKQAEAEFLLVGMGMNPFDAKRVLCQAEIHGHYKVAGLRPITPLADRHKESVKLAAQTLSLFDYGLRRNLIKEAAVIEDSETADKVLAMNFINPENVGIFAGYLPEIDTAMCKLAEMLLAARMGLKQVDEGAIERAMKNGEQVIEGLKALQQRELV